MSNFPEQPWLDSTTTSAPVRRADAGDDMTSSFGLSVLRAPAASASRAVEDARPVYGEKIVR
jgi:hypothetical protein